MMATISMALGLGSVDLAGMIEDPGSLGGKDELPRSRSAGPRPSPGQVVLGAIFVPGVEPPPP